MKTKNINNNPIVMWGDVHGNWDYLEREIKRKKITDINFIQVGDFGVGMQPYEREIRQLEFFDEVLRKANCKVYAIRGNHDNPFYFDNKENGKYKNIIFVEDYTVLIQDGINILCIGGAISVDRVQRKIKNIALINEDFLTWFENENFVFDGEKLDEIINNVYIDVVVTHTAPATFYPAGFNRFVMEKAAQDLTLLEELKNERDQMQEVYDKFQLKPRYWFYGHFHDNVTQDMGETIATLIGINELKEIRI